MRKKRKVEEIIVEKKFIKRKRLQSSESEIDSEVDVLDIVASSRRKIGGKIIVVNIQAAPLDNVSFHYKGSVQKWKYAC